MKLLQILALVLISNYGYSQKKLIDKLENYMNAQASINNFGGTVLISRNDTILLKKPTVWLIMNGR